MNPRDSLYSSQSLLCFSKEGKGFLRIFQVLNGFPGVFFVSISKPFDEVLGFLSLFPNVEDSFDFIDDRIIAMDYWWWLDN